MALSEKTSDSYVLIGTDCIIERGGSLDLRAISLALQSSSICLCLVRKEGVTIMYLHSSSEECSSSGA